jgi:membrane protease YdiL (CAAX protease family)
MAAGQAAFRHTESPAAQTRSRDRFELAIGYGLILLVIWTPNPWQRPLYLAAAAFILVVSWRAFDSWAAMGVRVTNLLRSMWIAGAALLFSAVSVAFAARLHTLRPWQGPVELVQRFWGYAIWAFLQQFLLQIFFLQRFLRLVSSKNLAISLAVAVFTAAHLPNPLLTTATLLWGLAACLLFLRYRNLIPLGITHAILGVTIALCFPGPVTHNMRVGLGYLTYSPHPHHRHNRSSFQPQRP